MNNGLPILSMLLATTTPPLKDSPRNAYGLQFTEAKSKSGKKFRHQFDLLNTHKPKSGAYKKNGSSTLGCTVNSYPLKRSVHHAAKVVSKLPFANDKQKTLLLRRLGKLNKSVKV